MYIKYLISVGVLFLRGDSAIQTHAFSKINLLSLLRYNNKKTIGVDGRAL